MPCKVLGPMVNPSRRTETGSASETPSENNSSRKMVEKEPKEEVANQMTGKDRSKRIRGPPGSGNGKEKVMEVHVYTIREFQ